MMKKIHKKQGFSLVEALIAMMVLLVGVLAVIQLFPTGIKSAAGSKNETQATDLAQAKMEELLSISYDSIVSSPSARVSSDPASPYYNYYRQIDVSYLNQNLTTSATDIGLKKITITCTWQESGSNQSISIDSIKSK